jgi:hypothetical protein
MRISSTVRSTNGGSSNFRSTADLGVMSLAEVRLQEGESLENALRRKGLSGFRSSPAKHNEQYGTSYQHEHRQ